MKVLAYQSLALILFPLLSLAQERPADSTNNIEELLLFYEQEELLVVTATRYSQKKKESPSAITVITKEDIKKHSWRNLIEALETVVGFDVTYNRRLRRPEIGARGMLGGSVGKRVLVMVDSRPVNRAADGSSDLGFETPLNNIERVEIIRGPGSALYGPNAFSGVINIITLPPAANSTTDLSVTYGTGNTRGYDLNASNTIGAVGLSLSVSGIHFDDEGIWKTNEDLSRDSLWGKLTYGDFILSAGYNKNDKGLPVKGRYDDGDFQAENRLWFVDGKYAFQATQNLNVNLHAYLNNEDRRLTYADKIVGTHPHAQNQTKDEVRTGGDITLDYLISESFRFVSGAEIRHEEFKFNLDLGSNRRETTNTGIFFQGEGRFLDGLLITAGGRYDDHSIYDGVVSPRLSASYPFL
ncbi:MAG: TonB-dependent receptor, partial [Candidatus Marinimicrobia bacterium]|nr:TonB-dependent receptor [Candidatus Neomarinimicrobiota bacterium]